jgi:CxxC-x17-CxxC domain-containing protein
MAFKKAGKGSYDRGPSKSYGRDRDGGSRGGYSGGRAGGRTGGTLALFDVTCAQCGTATQVPFKPTGERPVLCRSCFNGGDGSRGGDSRPSSRSSGSSGPSSSELREINEKLDKIMQALDIE